MGISRPARLHQHPRLLLPLAHDLKDSPRSSIS
jgi:hypothetical protein